MLKLMKYEFIHSMRTYFIAFSIFLGVCAITPFVIQLPSFSEMNIAFIPILFSLGFGFLAIGICIALFVSIFTHYYRSMFQKPAYLTMTLPVTSLQLIISKLVMSIVWLFVGFAVLIAGMITLMLITLALEGNLDFSHFWDGLDEVVTHMFTSFLEDPMHVFEVILTFVSALVYMVSTIYFALTISHTKWLRKHRLLFGLIFYFIFNLIIERIMGAVLGVSYMNSFSIEVSFAYIIVDIILVVGTVYILDHHIEIE